MDHSEKRILPVHFQIYNREKYILVRIIIREKFCISLFKKCCVLIPFFSRFVNNNKFTEFKYIQYFEISMYEILIK